MPEMARSSPRLKLSACRIKNNAVESAGGKNGA